MSTLTGAQAAGFLSRQSQKRIRRSSCDLPTDVAKQRPHRMKAAAKKQACRDARSVISRDNLDDRMPPLGDGTFAVIRSRFGG